MLYGQINPHNPVWEIASNCSSSYRVKIESSNDPGLYPVSKLERKGKKKGPKSAASLV